MRTRGQDPTLPEIPTPSNGAKPFAVWHDSARKRVNSGW